MPGGITSLWGSGRNDVYAGGARALFRFDGERWAVVRRGEDAVYPVGVDVVGGSGPADVFSTSSHGLHRFDGRRWTLQASSATRVSATRPDDVHGILGRQILRFDGESWKPEPPVWPFDGTLTGFNGIWVARTGEVVAVGAHGVIATKVAGAWSVTPTVTLHSLGVVWGSGADDIYAGGGARPLLHFDGCGWSPLPAGTEDVSGIWGSAWNDVFVVGWRGTIRHFDGRSWSSHDSGTRGLGAVWGDAPDRVFAVGAGGVVLRFDGTAWATHSSPTTEDLHSVAGNERGIMVGTSSGDLFQLEGSRWKTRARPVFGGRLMAVGGRRYVFAPIGIWRDDGDRWTFLEGSSGGSTYGVGGTSDSDLFAVGATGLIRRFDGTSWRAEASGVDTSFRAVWASPHVVVAVGEDGTIVRRHRSKGAAKTP
jgi:hypothetical protein